MPAWWKGKKAGCLQTEQSHSFSLITGITSVGWFHPWQENAPPYLWDKNINQGCSIHMLTCMQTNTYAAVNKHRHKSILYFLHSFFHLYFSLKQYLLIDFLSFYYPPFVFSLVYLSSPFLCFFTSFICLLLTASHFPFICLCFNEFKPVSHISAFPSTHSHSLHSVLLLTDILTLCLGSVSVWVTHDFTVSVALKKLDKQCLLNLGAANARNRLYCNPALLSFLI